MPLRLLHLLLLIPLTAAPAKAQGEGQAPQGSDSIYEMRVELLPDEKLVRGTQRIRWRNTLDVPTSELQLHLYINAFRDRSSTFMREADAEFRSRWRDGEFGSVELQEIAVEAQGTRSDLTAAAHHIQPDDGNTDDATVLRIPLPNPVAAGGEITLHTRFTTRLPKAYRRTGYMPGDGFFCMHWFPKLGVLQKSGGKAAWNCHQFHANTEFFANFSDYDVEITLPKTFMVGASGVPQAGRYREDEAAGRKTVAYRAERVHDFAWVADPDFVLHQETFGPISAAEDPMAVAVAKQLGVPVAEFDLPETEILLLLRPEHDTAEQRKRHFEAIKCGLLFFGLRFGPYPYPTVTAVDPGRDVQGRRLGGGMEYPTLFTCGTTLFPHDRRQRPEGVTVHEFGHQYWYGLSANNEFEESWLDEGINTYTEGRALWLHYATSMFPVETTDYGLLTVSGVPGPLENPNGRSGPGLLTGTGGVRQAIPSEWGMWADQVGLRMAIAPDSHLLALLRAQPTATFAREVEFTDAWNDRRRSFSTDNPDAIVRDGWEYLHRGSYVANSYHRPATLLRTMERLVGQQKWWAFLRRFHAQSRYQHPTTADFVGLLGQMCGSGAAAFFEAAAGADAHLDYGIESVSPPDGRGPGVEVIVRRYGSLSADVQVSFRFADREAPVYRAMRADDPYPWKRFRFAADQDGQPFGDLLEVWVDPPGHQPGAGWPYENVARPAGVYLIDENLLNNAWRAEPDHGPALYRGIRLLLQAQSRLAFAGLGG